MEPDQEIPPSLHPYLYAGADPVNREDPSGESYLGQVTLQLSMWGIILAARYPNIARAVDFAYSAVVPAEIQLTLRLPSLGATASGLQSLYQSNIRGYAERLGHQLTDGKALENFLARIPPLRYARRHVAFTVDGRAARSGLAPGRLPSGAPGGGPMLVRNAVARPRVLGLGRSGSDIARRTTSADLAQLITPGERLQSLARRPLFDMVWNGLRAAKI
jgi:hypothetical protein